MKDIKKRIKEIEILDILNKLPEIIPLNSEKEFIGETYDVFFCALGFEERCLTIPEQLTKVKDFKCDQAIYFEYSINVEDNSVNRPRLIEAFKKFADSWDSLQCDTEEFTKNLRELLNRIIASKQKSPKVMFYVSSCSSKLLISVMKVLLEFNIYLRIVYSEALVYHPTSEEYDKEPEKWKTEEAFGIARGVGRVIPNPEYSGARRENPDLIVAFPTLKPERTEAIITYIDEALALRPQKRIIWMIGDPHRDKQAKRKRKNIIREINKITKEDVSHEICTLDYQKTLEKLDQIYKSKNLNFHINISALGSKMQSLGISLFCYMRPDVSVYHAIPKEFNPKQYSKGCKATWQIIFGDLTELRNILDKVGQLEIV